MNRTICLMVVLLLALGLASACAPTASSKPTILLTFPTHGSQFPEGENVAVQCTATDPSGITRVELLVDGTLMYANPLPSPQTQVFFQQTWKATPGTHTIAVRAYNTAAVGSDIAAVSVSILPAAAPVVVATPSPLPPGGTPPAPGACTDNAALVAEAMPEGTTLAPNQAFVRAWRLQNSGTCTWGSGYVFQFAGGEAMAATTAIPVANTAPGTTADLLSDMTAPAMPGIHQSLWQMRNANGALFGDVVDVSITVVATASPTQTSAPPAAGPAAPPPTRASIPLLPSWWFTRTPTWTPHPGVHVVPSRTWTPHPGIGVVPSRTPTRITSPSSDRNLKANIVAVSPRDVLARLLQVPIATWNYKDQSTTIRHMGPMAQDFYAAFDIGEADTYIMQVDADGVAFAAIQGLYQIVQEKDAQITTLQKQNATLEARITALEQRLGGTTFITQPSSIGSVLPWFTLCVMGGIWLVRQKTGGRL